MNDHLTLLRQLDPAREPATDLSARARTDLERILATERWPARRPGRSPARRRPRGRTAVGLVAAGTLAVVGVLAPSVLRGGDTAFASWTPTGIGLSSAERADAGESCRRALADDPAARDATVAVAERRGDWTTVVLSADGGFSGLCITDESAGWFRGDMIGSVGVAVGAAAVGDRALLATDLGSGTMSAGDLSLAAGVAGSEVRGVSLRTETHGVVEATVADGRFALWFPGDELEEQGVVPVQVAYADGSTARVRLAL